MCRWLMWVLAAVAAFAIQTGTAAAHEARGNPVPQACQRANLTPRARARCAVIAHTRRLCHRPHLSKDRRLLCTSLQRFAGEPLFNMVRVAADGAVRSIHLIETATGREVYTAYPYGIAFAAKHAGDRVLSMKVKRLRSFLDLRPSPVTAQAPAASNYATGLPIGWNDSTGVAPGQCFNYTIQTPSNPVEQASFSSKTVANSTAQQIKVSATVNGSYAAFSASDSFSFSDQWQSSSNSSNQYFNLFSIYNLDSTVDPLKPLNTQGGGAKDSFDTLCGSQYMSSVPVGMFATISINYGSSSASTQTSISNAFSGSSAPGLGSITAAVSSAKEGTNSTFYFAFSMILYGGGLTPAADLNDQWAAVDPSDEAYYALCAQGNTTACGTFTSNMGTGANNAIKAFDTEVSDLSNDLSNGVPPDLSFLETFPNGVVGASTTPLVATDIPNSTATDILSGFKTGLLSYVNLMNQIATLRNRVDALSQLLDNTPAFNPTTLLDVESTLSDLDQKYGGDRTTLSTNLGTCLATTPSNATEDCQPVQNAENVNAYQWYGGEGGGAVDISAQQNTLALQYTALDGATPLDVLYISKLPPFTSAGSNIPIAKQAALIGFQDRPPPVGNPGAFIDILALTPNEPISTDNISNAIIDQTSSSYFTLWNINGFTASGPQLTSIPESFFTGNACAPTLEDLCAIDYSVGPFGTEDVQNLPIQGGLF